MDRLKFFKSLGVLAGSFLIPSDKILSVTNFIESKTESKGIGNTPYNFPLTDHKMPKEDIYGWGLSITHGFYNGK